ncbi:hypothetical protein [Hypericibacter terrae]|uniref:hypothetical protein n=1 Tax=Hypericibacter terrae TaxID=2602015 RepID=UPI0012459119|nr:hypothetical protein [Hypericibacter terrae]
MIHGQPAQINLLEKLDSKNPSNEQASPGAISLDWLGEGQTKDGIDHDAPQEHEATLYRKPDEGLAENRARSVNQPIEKVGRPHQTRTNDSNDACSFSALRIVGGDRRVIRPYFRFR